MRSVSVGLIAIVLTCLLMVSHAQLPRLGSDLLDAREPIPLLTVGILSSTS
jgi:hypothetical protein